MKNTGKIIAVLLSGAIAALSCACSSGSTGTSSAQGSSSAAAAGTNASTTSAASSAPAEKVTLKLVEAINDYTATDNEVIKALDDKLNIDIQFTTSDTDKFKTLMAGNDLGDIVSVGSTYQNQLIEGNQVIALDDLLTANGQNILKNTGKMIDYSKQYMSDGQNKVYFLSTHSVNSISDFENQEYFNYQMGLYVRWDYYAELGYPEVKSDDDLLNVLAQMQAKHPKSVDNKKTYGISYWADWGNFCIIHGADYDEYGMRSYTTYDHEGNIKPFITSADSYVWKEMKFLFKANQKGLLDPDSFTQKYDNFKQKLINGQAFTTNNGWGNNSLNAKIAKNFGEKAGMALLPTAYPAVFANAYSPVGRAATYSVGITSSCKNPDRAMQLLDYLTSDEGARLEFSGVEGTDWTKGSDGKPAITDATLSASTTDADFVKKTGIGCLDHFMLVDDTTKNSADGEYANLFIQPTTLVKENTAFTKTYDEHFGIEYPGQIVKKLAKEGKVTEGLYNTLAVDMMPQLSDDQKRVSAQIDDYIGKLAPKVALAKDEAEADSLIAQAQKDLKDIGADTLNEWEKTEYEKAKKNADQFTTK